MAFYDYYTPEKMAVIPAWDRSQAVSSRQQEDSPCLARPKPWIDCSSDPTKPMILALCRPESAPRILLTLWKPMAKSPAPATVPSG